LTRFRKPCLECGKLSFENRCETHQAIYKTKRAERYNSIARKEKKKLLYGGDYQKRRAAVLANAVRCHICREYFKAGDKIDADHLIPGNPNSDLMPAHASCNRSRGNKPIE